MVQEQPAAAVKDGAPGDILPADDFDQAAFEQAAQHGAALDASDIVDLRAKDRLAIRDDGQRFNG